jgi:hypothetical protein
MQLKGQVVLSNCDDEMKIVLSGIVKLINQDSSYVLMTGLAA